MSYDPEIHHRRSIRLREYDYSRSAAYFVTICTHGRHCVLGDIEDGVVLLNQRGSVVQGCWLDLPMHYPDTELDAYVIMPNHIHGIIVLANHHPEVDARHTVGAGLRPAPTHCPVTKRHGLSELVRAFKSFSTRRVNELAGTTGTSIWQRNYYEHIIRSSKSLKAIRKYIEANPVNWALDPDNPVNIKDSARVG